MAQRRMFSKEITTSDKFVDMPQSTRLLYYDLGMEADDEGFIGNARMLSRAYGANIDDLKLLQAKGFIIIFESGVTVVKDWNVNNKIRKDRIKPTIYTDEKSMLSLDNTGVYQLGNQMSTNWQPNVNQMSAQDRIGEVRLGKDRLDEDSEISPSAEISDLYQQEIGILSPSQFEQLTDYINLDALEIDVVKRAITKASDNGKRSFSYINSILRNWKNNGIKTIVQVEEEQREFENKKQTGMTDKEREDLKQPDEFYGF